MPPAVRLRLRLARSGQGCRYSHLGQIRAFRSASRSAGLPEPVRLSFGPAVSAGHESAAEYVDLYLRQAWTAAEVRQRLALALPAGYRILSVKRVPLFFPALEAVLNVVEYEIRGEFGPQAEESLRKFIDRDEILVARRKPGRAPERINLKPLLLKAAFEGDCLRLRLRFGPHRTVKPEAILSFWLGGAEPNSSCREGGFTILRKDLFLEASSGELLTP